jgi:hypothetical protein
MDQFPPNKLAIPLVPTTASFSGLDRPLRSSFVFPHDIFDLIFIPDPFIIPFQISPLQDNLGFQQTVVQLLGEVPSNKY